MTDPRLVARLVAESRRAQGLPPKVQDAATLRRIAVLLRSDTEKRTGRRDAA